MWLGHHFQDQKVKGHGHQAALVGCSSHHITYVDANSATAHIHHLHGAGAYCGGLPCFRYIEKFQTKIGLRMREFDAEL